MDKPTTFDGDSLAAEAAKLAEKLWSTEKRGDPESKPNDYLRLVNMCAKALRGAAVIPKRAVSGRTTT